MKKTNPILITILAILMCSCHTTKITGDNGGLVDAEIEPKPDMVDPAVLDNFRKIVPAVVHTTHKPKTPNHESSVLNGEWTIMQVGNIKIEVEEEVPYIIFNEKDGKIYAFNGCNIINGSYTSRDNKEVTFSKIISTMRLCPDSGFENAISALIADGKTMKLKYEKKGYETYLYLTDNKSNKLMTLRRHNLETVNGQWQIDEIAGEEVSGDVFNLYIDVNELKVHGNTGCNFFNGVISIDQNTPSSIGFNQLGVTQRACPNQEVERQMLVALEETYTYRLIDDTMQLLDCNGLILMKLSRAK